MRERRLVFGEVADLYDRYRPGYPPRLIDDLIELAGLDGRRAALEVGAGTGKATVMFAARRIPIVAVEPSEAMLAVVRANYGGCAGIEIEQCDFERWDPRGRRFPLLFSAQAWHWVEPAAGYAKARQALAPHGLLAPFWNRVAWSRSDAREGLLEAYERAAPQLTPDGPMHPANLSLDGEADWVAQIAASEGLQDPEVRYYEWEQEYSAAEYTGLLATTSEMRLLTDARRASLLAAVGAVIDAQGGLLRLPMSTRLCLARRS